MINVHGNAEPTPDLDIEPRVIGCDVDMGAYEVASGPGICCADTNNDGAVNVDDLNNVILDWGTDGSDNGGDIVDNLGNSPGDGVVDVNDLNAIIVMWGDCEQALELPPSVQACLLKLGHDPIAVLACIAAAGYWE